MTTLLNPTAFELTIDAVYDRYLSHFLAQPTRDWGLAHLVLLNCCRVASNVLLHAQVGFVAEVDADCDRAVLAEMHGY